MRNTLFFNPVILHTTHCTLIIGLVKYHHTLLHPYIQADPYEVGI